MKPVNIVKAIVAVLLVAVLGAAIWFINRPLGLETKADKNHHCEQFEDCTCADAAAVSALSWIGVVTTERQMVIAAKTDRHGTEPKPLGEAIRSLAPNSSDVIKAMPPISPGHTFVIGIVNPNGKGHCVCAHGVADGWIVDDPALSAEKSPQHWSQDDFSTTQFVIEVK